MRRNPSVRRDSIDNMSDPRTITTIGWTEIAEGEDPDVPDSAAWHRAAEHAAAKARLLAAATKSELGGLISSEEVPADALANPARLVLRMTYGLQYVAGERDRGGEADESILDYVQIDLRPLYDGFRSRVLESEPRLVAAPAPLRNGKRRYEGFRLGSRGIMFASFRRRDIQLNFQLPEGHGLPPDEFVTRGKRDWRIIDLASDRQLDGAILMAEDTIRAFKS